MSICQLKNLSNAFDVFSIEELLTEVDIKKSQIAADMCALLCYSGVNRSQLAEKLKISKSRVSNMLSGESNLTIESICNFSNALEFDFDIVFFNKELPQPLQPWQIISGDETQGVTRIREEFLSTINRINSITSMVLNIPLTDDDEETNTNTYSFDDLHTDHIFTNSWAIENKVR